MPILKTRSNHTKMYRPNGTRYTNARVPTESTMYSLVQAVHKATDEAMGKFCYEFGAPPNLDEVIIEIVCGTAIVDLTLYEIKDRE